MVTRLNNKSKVSQSYCPTDNIKYDKFIIFYSQIIRQIIRTQVICYFFCCLMIKLLYQFKILSLKEKTIQKLCFVFYLYSFDCVYPKIIVSRLSSSSFLRWMCIKFVQIQLKCVLPEILYFFTLRNSYIGFLKAVQKQYA